MKRADQMPVVIHDRKLIALRALKERRGLGGKRFKIGRASCRERV